MAFAGGLLRPFGSSSEAFDDEHEAGEPEYITKKIAGYLEKHTGRVHVGGGKKRSELRLQHGDALRVGCSIYSVEKRDDAGGWVLMQRCSSTGTRRLIEVGRGSNVVLLDSGASIFGPDVDRPVFLTCSVFSPMRDWLLRAPFDDDVRIQAGRGYRVRQDGTCIDGSREIVCEEGSFEAVWRPATQVLRLEQDGAVIADVDGHVLVQIEDDVVCVHEEFLLLQHDSELDALHVIAGDVSFAAPCDNDPVLRKAAWQSRRVVYSAKDMERALDPCREHGELLEVAGMSIGWAQLQGNARESMEDRVLCGSTASGEPYAVVFDGHCGHEAADIARESFAGELSRLRVNHEDLVASLRQIFIVAHARILDAKVHAGTTASLVLVSRQKGRTRLYTANVGDSRAILGMDGATRRLSYDHKPYELDEACGVLQRNGWVEDERVKGSLAVTRALGNASLVDEGVSQEPDISQLDIDKSDRFIIIGSDGLWDEMDDATAADFVRLCLDAGRNCREAAKRLCGQALLRSSHDNVSAVVIARASEGV